MSNKEKPIKKNKSEMDIKRKLLIEVHSIGEDEVNKMSDEDVSDKILKLQKKELAKAKNPNKFWIINGLPEPKQHEVTTKKSWGIWVVVSLFILFAGFFGMFFWLAFR